MTYSIGRRLRLSVLVVAMLAVLLPLAQAAHAAPTPVFINEIHYDNASSDVGEAIEVAGPTGTNLSGYSLALYNGSSTQLNVYRTVNLTGVLPDHGVGMGTLSFAITGIQNGSPDGVALVRSGAVLQFLSYEGTFTASSGPATGMTSVDIGQSESSATPVGSSLQLEGTGSTYEDFAWVPAQANTFASQNTGQTFTEPILPDPTGSTTLVVNEIDYDQPGGDFAEFVEIYNLSTDPISLSGWTIELVNGSGGGASIYQTVALPDVVLAAGDYYVVCEDAATVANCDLDAISSIQNGGPDAVALRSGTDLIDTVSYEGDTAAPYTETSGSGLADSGSTPSVGISRFPDGTDSDVNNIDLLSVVCATPGEANTDSTVGCAPPLEVKIHEVQGSEASSPLIGEFVAIEGVVVGDYEGSWPNLRGFYVQEEDADHDGDPATSEGVFVFHGDEDEVSLGDQVRVEGVVAEFQDQTQLNFPSSLTVLDTGQSGLTSAAQASLPVPTLDHFERFEGMLVTFSQSLYVTEHFRLGRFAMVDVSSGDRLFQPTNVADPGAPAAAIQEANDRNRLIIDDALVNQNPDPIIFGRGGNELTATNTLRGGDSTTGATGIMTYTWSGDRSSGNAYRLRPPQPVETTPSIVFDAGNARPSSAPDVGGDLTVVSFNVLNYFLTIDVSSTGCGPDFGSDCRGADSELEFDRQRAKLLAALEQVDADVLGLVELENTPGVSPEADLAGGLSAEYAVVDVGGDGIVGTDVIRTGIIYKPGTVTPLGDPAVLTFALDPLGEPRNRAAIAQTFAENATGEVFTVVVNHFKSKGGSEIDNSGGECSVNPSYPDCDQGDGQGYFNATRTSASQQLVDWLATSPTGSLDPDVMILGDLNAYAKEDPIGAFEANGYTNLHSHFGNSYSYVFSGQWGFLDYALASASLLGQVTGAEDYHINSDEPGVLDYNTSFQSPEQIVKLYAPDEFRTSDHDPVLIGLSLDAIDARIAASPDRLWPPDHKYRNVEVSADDDGTGLDVLILGAVSSEPDSGINDDDVPNDIVVTGPDTIDLRAERDDEGPG
ncbi:MAG: ExeM/NucH family extracellular endonuclease, partial [Acidimicrobiia bacterium]